jgi:uncharacterized protein YecE (DUF72 family)
MTFYLGCAVWSFPGWVGELFPPGSKRSDWLGIYGQSFSCVEGNTTFYATPSEEILHRWVLETPENFRFCLKIPRSISHQGRLVDMAGGALGFFHHCRKGLGQRLGPVLLQLPPSYGPEMGHDLSAFLNRWRREAEWPISVEVRHVGWYAPEISTRLRLMLGRMGYAQVVLDTRPVYEGPGDAQAGSERKKPSLPLQPDATSDRVFIRFISHPERNFNRSYLEEWAERVHVWLDEGKEVFFFVHCPQEEHSPGTARLFQEILEARGAPVPALGWDKLPPIPRQQGLF